MARVEGLRIAHACYHAHPPQLPPGLGGDTWPCPITDVAGMLVGQVGIRPLCPAALSQKNSPPDSMVCWGHVATLNQKPS